MSTWFARNRARYPVMWDQIAREAKEAANWRCEACSASHGPPPHVLTVDHVVDHAPGNVAPENLAVLCQRCYLRRQALRPPATTKAEAIRRLRDRVAREASQGRLAL